MVQTERLFVSVHVKPTDDMESFSSELEGIRGIRAVSKSQMHVTFAFLGDTDVRRIPELVSRIGKAVSGMEPFGVKVRGVGAFPKASDPRVIWLGLEDGGRMTEVAEAVRRVLDDMHLGHDDKRFIPHLTVARVNGSVDISGIAERWRDRLFSEFTIDSVDVMRSELHPDGARHRLIERIPF